MRKYCFTVVLLISLLAVFSLPASAADREFTIINATGAELYHLSITPANSSVQGANALKHELPDGQRVRLVFPNYDSSVSQWDIAGLSCCGQKFRWNALTLHTAQTITLRPDGIAELGHTDS